MTIINVHAETVETASRDLSSAREKMKKAKSDLKDIVSQLHNCLGDKHFDEIEQMAITIRKALEDGENKLYQCEMRLEGLAESIRKYGG